MKIEVTKIEKEELGFFIEENIKLWIPSRGTGLKLTLEEAKMLTMQLSRIILDIEEEVNQLA